MMLVEEKSMNKILLNQTFVAWYDQSVVGLPQELTESH
jgi:hypothetical protein